MPLGYGDTAKAALLTELELEQSVVITDPAQSDNPMIFISEEFEVQTGYSAEEALGRNCRFLQGPDTDSASVAAIRRSLDAGCPITVDILNYRRGGSPFWNRLRIKPLYGEDGSVMFFAGVQHPTDAAEARPGFTNAVDA